MTKTSNAKLAAFFEGISDSELKREFDTLKDRADSRVKSGPNAGQIKLSVAKYGDKILRELRRRADAR